MRKGGSRFTIQPVTAVKAEAQLRRLSLLIFLTAETAMTVTALIYLAVKRTSVAVFLVDFAVYTVILLLLVLAGYFWSKRVWLRLHVTQGSLDSISNILTDAVFFLDPDYVITTWSRGAERVLGYSEKEAVGQSISMILPDDFVERDLEAMTRFEEKGLVERYRTFRKRKGGELFPVETSAQKLVLPNGQLVGIISVMRDVTENHVMQEKLSESEARYRELFDSSADGIVWVDTDGRILDCNDEFAQMLGYSKGELRQMTSFDVTPPEWHAVDKDVITNQLLINGRSDEYSKEYLRKDGTRVAASLRVWVHYDREGNPQGAWALVRDLSVQRKYEQFIRDTIVRLEDANERLKELDTIKNEFVAVVSHELRGPLGTIESGVHALESLFDSESPPEELELLAVLNRGVLRLSSLIEDLLDVTRIESGQLRLRPELVDSSELVEKVVLAYRARFAEKGLVLSCEQPDGPCMGHYDPVRIEQVLVNLVDNAYKFTEKGDVKINLECTPNSVVYSVQDSGPGIPPELHQKIFEKFASLETTQENGKVGIGLGLAISKGIIEAHGGRIWVESTRGGGSRFCFSVPREPQL